MSGVLDPAIRIINERPNIIRLDVLVTDTPRIFAHPMPSLKKI